jgi:DNA-binding beta-propeller fold protein YncE
MTRRSLMRFRWTVISLFLLVATMAAVSGEKPKTMPPAPASGSAAAAAGFTALPLPGAPADGVILDYLAVDRARHRVWVPASGTGNTVVIDTKTLAMHRVENFPTAEVERRGQKRIIGPTAASVGDGVVYVGDRADSSVCAVDAATLERTGCVKLEAGLDGVAFVGKRKEVWVTTPRDDAIVILDVSAPKAPKITGTLKLEGEPEGYAVDEGRGFFYTNLEDKDRTLRIDVSTRKVVATWMPACGEEGPRGLALEPAGQLLMVACTDHVEVLDAGKDGQILSKLDTGKGLDNLDYLPERRSVYAAAAGAAKLTVAHLDENGVLKGTASVETAKGARNAVVDEDGVAYIADGPEGKILVVRPTNGK